MIKKKKKKEGGGVSVLVWIKIEEKKNRFVGIFLDFSLQELNAFKKCIKCHGLKKKKKRHFLNLSNVTI